MYLPRTCYHSRKNFDNRVDDLVRKYYDVSEPNPALQDVLKNPDGSSLLFKAVRRQVALIRCRSHAPEDDQITIYDKALLLLTRYGEEPEDICALELYMTEFLGIVPISPLQQSREDLSQHIELQKILNKGSHIPTHSRFIPNEDVLGIEPVAVPEGHVASEKQLKQGFTAEKNTRTDDKSNPRVHRSESYLHEKTMPDKTAADTGQDSRSQAERILGVYYKARDDYFQVIQNDGVAHMSVIRFLRDTAENALLYLHKSAMLGHPAIPDLQQTFAFARDKAAELSGGRKRYFDEGAGRHGHKRARRQVDSYRPAP